MLTIDKIIATLIELDADTVRDSGTNPEYARGAAQALASAAGIAQDGVPDDLLNIAAAVRARRGA